MGKSRHASSNSRAKSTGKHLKKKKEKGGRRKREKSEDVSRNCDQEEKEKKTFWRRWINFFRLFRRHKKDKNDDLNSSKKNSVANIESAESSMDLIEISTEPRSNISKILIKPAKRGIQTMITECEETSLVPLQMDGRVPARGPERNNAENVQINRRRWSWDTEIVKNETQIREKSRHPLTPALYVRREMNADTESAVFIEPDISNECIEINQTEHSKTIKINQREIRYRFIGKETGESRKTFKSVSEPTWDEKKKMFHRKRLHENLNELLEQFMFLEEEDVINFSGFQSKGVLENRRRSLCGQSSFMSETRREPFLKELSRKVSPEILVNIKPFKEYLSGTLLNGSPAELVSVEEQLPPVEDLGEADEEEEEEEKEEEEEEDEDEEYEEEVEEEEMVETQKKALKKSKEERGEEDEEYEEAEEGEKEKKAKKEKTKSEKDEEKEEEEAEGKDFGYHCPVIRSKVHFSEDYPPKSREKENPSEEEFGAEEQEGETMCRILNTSESWEPPSKVVFGASQVRADASAGICAVFGVYKAYAGAEGTVHRREVLRNASLEEVLENLDDRDHDLIFKKNMTQFKKKINSKQRFENRKAGSVKEANGKVEAECKKIRKQDNKIQVFDVIPEVDSIRHEVEAESVPEKAPPRFGDLSVENVGPEFQLSKVLGIRSLASWEFYTLPRGILAYRVQTSPFRITQRTLTFGDRRDASERVEYLVTEERTQKEEVVTPPERFDSLFGFDPMKNLNGIAKLMSFGKNQLLNKFFCEKGGIERRVEVAASSDFVIPKYFSNPTECFYVLENYTFTSFDNKSSSKLNPVLSKEILGDGHVKSSVPEAKLKGESTVDKSTWTFYPQPMKEVQRAIKILTDPSYDFKVSVNNPPSCARRADRHSSDTAIAKKFDDTPPVLIFGSEVFKVNVLGRPGPQERSSVPQNSTTVLPAGGPASGPRKPSRNKQSDSRAMDGFEVIFDGLDMEDMKAESAKSLKSTSKDSGFFFYEAPTLAWETEEEKKKNKALYETCDAEIIESAEEKTSAKLLKFKSNSSPRESILQTECGSEPHRQRRSLNFSKEKLDCQKKKRSSAHSDKEILSMLRNSDKGVEVRSAGSTLMECRSPKPEGSFVDSLVAGESGALEVSEVKSSLNEEGKPEPRASGSGGTPDERTAVAVRTGDKRMVEEGREQKKVFVLEKEGASFRREVLAAVQSIKERGSCKEEAGGGGKRMSVVIMLSKK